VSGRKEGREDVDEGGEEWRSDCWLGWKFVKKVVKNFASTSSGDPTRPPGVTTLNETLV
jgi:hypothetical protein